MPASNENESEHPEPIRNPYQRSIDSWWYEGETTIYETTTTPSSGRWTRTVRETIRRRLSADDIAGLLLHGLGSARAQEIRERVVT